MAPNKTQAANITDKGKGLLTAIRAAGGDGITRKALAQAIGKTLNKWDLAQLDLLEDQGFVTSEARRVDNRPVLEYVYKATNKKQ